MTSMETLSPNMALAQDLDWWRGAVIYQIYPRSYQDSNGDGIGDLGGIISRLEYIASLGVDAIWISPFFTSPMLDFGYDVSDYKDVDPMFGTLSDFDALVAKAHKLGIKVLIDLVLSHSSDQHPWFAESRANKTNAKSDWYVWADAKPDGSPPNNWLSIFGGPAWQWDGERMQYYLHNFLKEQPDLNLHNAEVQDALLDVTRFWLERGVDGFRLDTINFYFHDQDLRNNPALAPEDRNSTIAPAVNPYNWQEHLYDKNRPENLDFLRRFRSLLNEFPGAMAVGEVGDAQRGMEIQAEYSSGGDKVQMCYSFEFLSGERPSAEFLGDVLTRFEATAPDGWACWAFSNHDVERYPTRWGLSEAANRAYVAAMMSMRGSVCLYQGEELGLSEADVDFDDLQDPYGIRFWPKFKGRDGCRTPMVWQSDNGNGGFTDAKPWLPVAAEHLNKSVAAQEQDDDSLLSFYRRMLAFRAAQPALVKGNFALIPGADGVLSFLRCYGDARVVCIFNLTDEPKEVALPAGNWTICTDAPFPAPDGQLIGPWGAVFAKEEA